MVFIIKLKYKPLLKVKQKTHTVSVRECAMLLTQKMKSSIYKGMAQMVCVPSGFLPFHFTEVACELNIQHSVTAINHALM